MKVKSRLFSAAGVLNIALGVAVITIPTLREKPQLAETFEMLMATFLLLAGTLTVLHFLTTTGQDDRGYIAAQAAVTLGAGLVCLLVPLDGMVTLTTLLGIYFAVSGAISAGWGVSLKGQPHQPYVFILAGLSIILSLILWLAAAGASGPVLRAMFGIDFVARGIVIFIATTTLLVAALDQTDSAEQTPPPAAEPEPEAAGA